MPDQPLDYIPGAETVSLARRSVNPQTTPVYDNPAITSDKLHPDLYAPYGATGTLILQGIIQAEDYNSDWNNPEQSLRNTDRMWRSDGQAMALLNVLTLPLTSTTKTIEPASPAPEDVRIAQFVSDNLFGGMDQSFSSVDEYVTRVWLRDGFGVLEKVYVKSDDGMIRLRKLAQRLNKTIYRVYPNEDDELDRIQQRVYTVDANGMSGSYRYPVIPAHKLVLFTHMREGNNFYGVSVFRPAWKHFYIKDKLEIIQAIQGERMALGVPTFKEPMGPVQKSDRDQAANLGASLHAHQSAFVSLPYGWDFLFTTPGAVLDLTPAIEYHALQMVRSVLAQFLNLDRGGSYALSMDISTFFVQNCTARATYLADEWTSQVIKPLVDMNFRGVTRYPKLVYGRIEGRQIDKFMVGLAAVLPWLTKNADTENAVRELLQLPDLPPDATAAGGGSLTVETSGTGQSADPESRNQEVGEGRQQSEREPGGEAAVPDSAALARSVSLSRMPDWMQAEVAVLLAAPHPGLSTVAYTDIVYAQAEALLSEGNHGNPEALRRWFVDGADGGITWGSHGDFDACVAIAGKYMDNPEGY